MPDDATERVYDYICRYFDEWSRPPLLDEIAEDLSLTPRQVMQVLALLEALHRLRPGSTLPVAL